MKKISKLLGLLLCLYFGANAQSEKSLYTQQIRGTVLDKVLQTPIPGAVVRVDGSDPMIAATTDMSGAFTLADVPIGRHTVIVSIVGYKELRLPNIQVSSGKETILNFPLEEDIVMGNEVVITGKKNSTITNNELIVNSAINLSPENINRFAGSRSDPARMAASYAGVAGGGDLRNDIIVRGNSPTGVLWRLEGVDIPNPNHFTFTGNTGGAFSILNNNLLASSDFLTGAFPAEYGNKTAAVFDVRLRNGNNQKRENTFQLGLNGIELGTEGPISKEAGSSYMASYRFLSFELLDKAGVSIGASGIPRFQDATFKVNLPTAKAGTFTLWSIAGKSNIFIETEIENPTPEYPEKIDEDDFMSEMFASGLSHTYSFSKNTTGKLILSASGNRIKVSSNMVYNDNSRLNDYEHSNSEWQYLTNYTLTHRFNSRHMVKAGIIARSTQARIYEEIYDTEDSTRQTGLNENADYGLLQAFAHWQYRINEKLTVNTGIYAQQLLLNNTRSLEPRASMSYDVSAAGRFTLAAGLHSQTLPVFLYNYRFYDSTRAQYLQNNKNTDMLRAGHAVVGYQHSISNSLYLKTELYYQHMYNVPVSRAAGTSSVFSVLNNGSEYGFEVADSLSNAGTGRNYGAEITLEKTFSQNYYFLTNLSLPVSRYKGGDGVERNTAFNIGHVYNLLLGKEFHLDDDNRKVISADFKLTHSGGRRIVDVDEEASLAQNKAVYDYKNAYSSQMPNYFRCDVKVSYTVNKEKSNHQVFIAADNVLNRQNVLTRYWDNREKKVVTQYQLGLFPYLGYRVQF